MNDLTESAQVIRSETEALAHKPMRVTADQRCALSGKPLLAEGAPYYVFSSGFAYLADALTDFVAPHLSEEQQARLDALAAKLGASLGADERDLLEAEVDGLVAAECPLTGSLMIESVDAPLPGLGGNGQSALSEDAARRVGEEAAEWDLGQ